MPKGYKKNQFELHTDHEIQAKWPDLVLTVKKK